MGKIDGYASGRNDGLLLALKIVEEDGVDALREEIKFRGAKGINTAMSKKELNKACTKSERNLGFSIGDKVQCILLAPKWKNGVIPH